MEPAERLRTGGHIGEVVRRLRGDRSLRDVADAAGIAAATLLHIENGSDPRLSTLHAVSYALGVDLADLLDGLELPEPSEPGASSEPPTVEARLDAFWRRAAGRLFDELLRRQAEDALGLVDHGVLADLTRAAIQQASPSTVVLHKRQADISKLLLREGVTGEVVAALLPGSPDDDDERRFMQRVAGLDWSAEPGRAFLVFASWAPPTTLRLADAILPGLSSAAPGTPLKYEDRTAYGVVHLFRGDLRVVVACVGFDVTTPSADVVALPDRGTQP